MNLWCACVCVFLKRVRSWFWGSDEVMSIAGGWPRLQPSRAMCWCIRNDGRTLRASAAVESGQRNKRTILDIL